MKKRVFNKDYLYNKGFNIDRAGGSINDKPDNSSDYNNIINKIAKAETKNIKNGVYIIINNNINE